jgi:hypothetical protein
VNTHTATFVGDASAVAARIHASIRTVDAAVRGSWEVRVIDLLHASAGYYPKFSPYRAVSLISISISIGIDHRKSVVSRDSRVRNLCPCCKREEEGVHLLRRAFGRQVSCLRVTSRMTVQRHAKRYIPMIFVTVARTCPDCSTYRPWPLFTSEPELADRLAITGRTAGPGARDWPV